MIEKDLPESTPQTVEGTAATDLSTKRTRGGGETGHTTERDVGAIGLENEATVDAGLAIEGGKLAGNHDDFEGELDEGPHPVPGANKHHHPAHAMNKGETKHLGS